MHWEVRISNILEQNLNSIIKVEYFEREEVKILKNIAQYHGDMQPWECDSERHNVEMGGPLMEHNDSERHKSMIIKRQQNRVKKTYTYSYTPYT
jgi:hypothetical protein